MSARLMDRRRTVAGALAVVVATSAAGFVVGSRITSPAEVASRTAPPTPSLILVPVEQRVLSTDVVTRGTGRFGSPQKLSVAASALKPNPGLVAELPLIGAELNEGDVAASASGRPLFVLVGERPMSRDLGPGLSGDDVHQLEQGLTRLGFEVGPIDGVYDEATEQAVADWYAANGYSAFTATPDQLSAVRSREVELAAASVDALASADAVGSATSALAEAQAAAARAIRQAAAAARAFDRTVAESAAANTTSAAELAAREAILDSLRNGAAVQSGTPPEVAAARADLTAANANQVAVRQNGLVTVAGARAALDRAPAQLDTAINLAASADGAASADVAAKQAALDAIVADPSTTESALALAEAELAAATASAENTRVGGAQMVAEARAHLTDAPGQLDSARAQASADDAVAAADVAAKQAAIDSLLGTVLPTAAEINAAASEVSIMVTHVDSVRLAGERAEDEAASAAADATADVSVVAGRVRAAESALANAELADESRSTIAELATREADLARRQAGVQVPADEIVFVATAPVRVSGLLVGTGDPATGGIVTVTDALVRVDAGLAVSDAGLVKPGMTVNIDEPDLAISTVGTVSVVAESPGTNGVDGFHVYVEVSVESPPPSLVGASVRLTIPVQSSGEAVLAVPVSALTLAPDGSSRVQLDSGGSTQFVSVVAGLSADGFVEIRAIDGPLTAGDLVVIGVSGG